MKKFFLLFLFHFSFLFSHAPWVEIKESSQMPSFQIQTEEEKAYLLKAIDQSLIYLNRKQSKYHFPKAGITHEQLLKSLIRFKELVLTSKTDQELDQKVKKEFCVYKVLTSKKNSKVLFTGYFEPVYQGSREQQGEYQYPLYRLPDDLVLDKKGKVQGRKKEDGTLLEKYWTRQEIDEEKKLAGKNLEIVYLKDPYEVYMAQCQGSVAIKLPDNEMVHLGYAARNHSTIGFSIYRELLEDGQLERHELIPHLVANFFKKHPKKLATYLKKNTSYVFFKERKEAPWGALSIKLHPEASIATDHTSFPKGALAYITLVRSHEKKKHVFNQFVLNQDVGGKIKGTGRCDIFFGTGPKAEKKAADMYAYGDLYFLFLKK